MSDEDKKVLKVIEILDTKLDTLDERLDCVDKTLIKQEASLDKHMYRTGIAEENIQLIREHIAGLEVALKPVYSHVSYMNGILKGIGIVGILAGVLGAVFKLAEVI